MGLSSTRSPSTEPLALLSVITCQLTPLQKITPLFSEARVFCSWHLEQARTKRISLWRGWALSSSLSRLKVFLSPLCIYTSLIKFLRGLVMSLKINCLPRSPSWAENELLVRRAAAKALMKAPGASSRHHLLFSGPPSVTIPWPPEEETENKNASSDFLWNHRTCEPGR